MSPAKPGELRITLADRKCLGMPASKELLLVDCSVSGRPTGSSWESQPSPGEIIPEAGVGGKAVGVAGS